MSSDSEMLGHRTVIEGTIGAALYRLREARGRTWDGQRRQLRLSPYDFRRLERRPLPPAATCATDVITIARDCNVCAPQVLLGMLREVMGLADAADAMENRKQKAEN